MKIMIDEPASDESAFGSAYSDGPGEESPPPDRDRIGLFECPVCEGRSAPAGVCGVCGCSAVCVFSDQATERELPFPRVDHQSRGWSVRDVPGWSIRYLPSIPIEVSTLSKLFILNLYCPRCAQLLTQHLNGQPYCSNYCRLYVVATSRVFGDRDQHLLIKMWYRQPIQTVEAIRCMTLETYYQHLDNVCASPPPVVQSPSPSMSVFALPGPVAQDALTHRHARASSFVSTFLIADQKSAVMPHEQLFEAYRHYVVSMSRTLPVNRVDKDILLRLVRERFPQPKDYRPRIDGKRMRCLVGIRLLDAFIQQFGDV